MRMIYGQVYLPLLACFGLALSCVLCEIVTYPMLHACPVGEGVVNGQGEETLSTASSKLVCFMVCGQRALCEAAMWRLNTCSMFTSRKYSCEPMDGEPIVFAKNHPLVSWRESNYCFEHVEQICSSSSSPSESKKTSSVTMIAHVCLEPEGGCTDLTTELTGSCTPFFLANLFPSSICSQPSSNCCVPFCEVTLAKLPRLI